jgi:VIT1/CCC1 family predicted Fe2+/Mn2+ transporter
MVTNTSNHSFRHKCLLFSFILVIVTLIAAVFVYCIHSGNKEIAIRMVENLLTVIACGWGGYVLGKSKREPPKAQTVGIMSVYDEPF